MKKGVLIILALLIASRISAQLAPNLNLVPNGKFTLGFGNEFVDTSFENSACWVGANAFLPIPGWMGGDGYFDTSLNRFVFQSVSSPNGITFFKNPFDIVKSTGSILDTNQLPIRQQAYAQTILLAPLEAGKTYRFTMYVKEITYSAATLARFSSWPAPGLKELSVIRNLGVYFSQTKVADYSNPRRLNLNPQIVFRGWSTTKQDTTEEVRLSGTYTAVGGERYIIIGNFDYAKDFVVRSVWPAFYPDTFSINNYNHVTDISLVRDTTQPTISLHEFSLGKDTAVCPNIPLTLGGQSHFLHYLWNTGATTWQIGVTQPGTYWCRIDYGCGTYTDTIEVLPVPPPAPFDLPDTALCAGRPYTAYAPAGYAHYLWSNGSTATTINIHTPGKSWLKASNACGQSFTDTFALVSTPSVIPGININTHPPIILCQGTPILFVTNDTGAGSSPRFQWYKNGLTIEGATARTYTDSGLANGDTLIVALYSSLPCPVTQPTISNKVGATVSPVLVPAVSVTASPAGSIAPGQSVTFTAAPVNEGSGPEYIWYLNDVPIPGNNSATWTTSNLRDGDFVKVRMESKVACPSPPLVFSNSVIMRVARTGITATEPGPGPMVYPSIVTDFVHIAFRARPLNAEVIIADAFGRIVQREKLIEMRQTVRVANWPAAVYFYRIAANGAEYSGKLLKQ